MNVSFDFIRPPRVIVPVDTSLAACLDPVAWRLAEAGCEVIRPPSPLPADWGDDLATADVVALTPRNRFTAADIAAAPRLKGIAFATIGVEALDLAAADAAGLAVGFGATDELVTGMAEANVLMIAAALLDLAGKAGALRQRGWRDGGVRARLVHGKTIGFVGFGRIARATRARLAGWGVAAIYYDPYVASAEAERVPDLATLIARADAIVVTVDQRPETVGMIGVAQFAAMKPGAVLVNAARGAVVDEAALIAALRDGRLAGAALDAFATEPLARDHPLRAFDNVLLTPHNLGHTIEQQESFIPALADNVLAIAAGTPPPYWKNPGVAAKWRERLKRLALT